MKKVSRKQREIDVKNGLKHRHGSIKTNSCNSNKSSDFSGSDVNKWIDHYKENLLNVSFKNNRVTIILPERLNFHHDYETTAINLNAIRMLAKKRSLSYKAYRLSSVNFDNLKSISTSAALVLTAELSKWDDAIRNRLRPDIENWNPNILINFYELGFFDLFQNKPSNIHKLNRNATSSRKIVKYIKGNLGDDQQSRVLKDNIMAIVGDKINKWMFLHSGISEAIINVSHHAYPKRLGYSEVDKNWYLTGSYNTDTKELKVVFYDQGIGIPKSLPASEVWERVLMLLSHFSIAERRRDEVLLKAAVELDRTSTEESDRGKGLQDLLEFIRQRRNGYLSIFSLKGMFKMEVKNGIESIKSEHFNNPVYGTLIIWSVTV